MAVSFSTRDVAPEPAPDTTVRLGLIALATDLTIESDLPALLPGHARLHVTRIAFANPTTPENLAAMAPHVAAAADLLVPGAALGCIGFGCTSGAVVIGDEALDTAVSMLRPGVPLVTPARAACAALHHLGARRIAVMTPYLHRTSEPVIAYMNARGLEVMRCFGLGMADDRDIARAGEAAILDSAAAADHPQADALFISCTALPAMALIERIEARLGKPVVTSNQALGWAMLHAAGLHPHGPGRLFAQNVAAA